MNFNPARSPGVREERGSLRCAAFSLAIVLTGAPSVGFAATLADAGAPSQDYVGETLAAQPHRAPGSEDRPASGDKGQPVGTVRPPTHRVLVKLEQQMGRSEWKEALRRIDSYAPRTQGHPYEQSLLQVARAYCLLSMERHIEAASVLNQLLGDPWVGQETKHNFAYNLAQIYVQQEDWRRAAPLVDSWLRDEAKPEPESLALAGYVQYRLKHFKVAANRLRVAIVERHRSVPKSPVFEWYQLLLASYQELGDDDAARALLRSFVTRFPEHSGNYWQLANTALRLSDPTLALASLELGAAAGGLNREGVRLQVRLLVQLGDPYRAARVAEEAMMTSVLPSTREDWDVLVDAWLLARNEERALAAARKAVPTGRAHFSLRAGEILLRNEEWKSAVQPLQEALDTSRDPPTRARIHLLLGISSLHRSERENSRRHLQLARGEESQRQEAERWLSHWRRQWPRSVSSLERSAR